MNLFGLGLFEVGLLALLVLPPLLIVLNVLLKRPWRELDRPTSAQDLASRIRDYYLAPYRAYATFGGRATRREFWTFSLINFGIGTLLGAIDVALRLPSYNEIGPLGAMFGFGTLIPSFTVTIRRLHDGNRSGWWLLLHPVPVIGWLIALYQLTAEGNPQDNRYGQNPRPKSVEAEAATATAGSA